MRLQRLERRVALLRLRRQKAANVNAPAQSPATLSAAAAAFAPGSGITPKPAARTASTSFAPGSEMPGVPASDTYAIRSPARRWSISFAAAARSLCSCTATSGFEIP